METTKLPARRSRQHSSSFNAEGAEVFAEARKDSPLRTSAQTLASSAFEKWHPCWAQPESCSTGTILRDCGAAERIGSQFLSASFVSLRFIRGWVLLFCLAALTVRAAEQTPLLDTWFAAQTNLHTFAADVIQTRTLKVLAQPLVSTGRVWIAIPDRFRWEIGSPAQTIALRLPSTLFIIYPKLKRAEKYPLDDKQPGPWKDVLSLLEASFPRSRADMESHFRVLSVTQTNATWQLALQPKSSLARRMMAEIDICVRTNDFVLTATEMKFADGSSMRNDFTNTVLNAPLPDECFDAKLDPAIKVVEPLKQ